MLLSAALLALVAGCGGKGEGLAERPKAKPEQVSVALADPNHQQGASPIAQARVSTKSGEILILEADGSVTSMQLDSAAGRQAILQTDRQMAALRDGSSPAWDGVIAKGVRREGPTARDIAMQEFVAQRGPALPEADGDATLDAADFRGVRITRISPDLASDLVEVSANLREGVDDDIAFSYATCALAKWAKDQGTPYARHIRTLQDERGGALVIGAVYMLSDEQPLGLRVMETNQTLRECRDRGIPAA
ncbi:hypothetical protein [Paracoccus tegillarcae]|uniref:Lipoprotein n=1 Tax=Paracoccus tegillarcae TaxID=1529068 RepID=A0A2K9F0D3_9RHOB|nr:hypothetical protein [Paracoccus tegillarcae]AUH35024.1 hypothetical protein CUV01_18045 [Paracoccus tegillarcae]